MRMSHPIARSLGALTAISAVTLGCTGRIGDPVTDGNPDTGAGAITSPGSSGTGAGTSNVPGGSTPGAGAPSASSGGSVAAGTGGTTATGTGGVSASGAPANCTTTPGTSVRVRRLTRSEFNQSVSDLLGKTLTPADAFPADTQADGYKNQADVLIVTPLLAEALSSSAEELANTASASLSTLNSCASSGDDTCAKQMIKDLGKRAYRRDLIQEEQDGLFKVYTTGKTGADFKAGMGLVLQAIFQSPNFVYRTEIGSGKAQNGVVTLTQQEIATELAYLVTGGPPDATLTAAAAAGSLTDANARAEQATRLLATALARPQTSTFFYQWLGVDNIETIQKDATMYPDFSAALATKMRTETGKFVESVVFDGDASLQTLLTANYTFADSTLAKLYGVTASGSAFSKVTLDKTQRSGLLTQGSVLTTFAQSAQSSPVRRGKFVRTRLLCESLPKPPKDVNVNPPPPTTTNTTRERFAAHASGTCATCHTLMDPVGFGFENFDGIGRYRSTDNGFPVDSSGELTGTQDANGKFNGVVELGQKLSQSAEVRACFVKNWFQFSMARLGATSDSCTVQTAFSKFLNGQETIRDLIVDIVRQNEFVVRVAPTAP
jgi:hypothetical protein